MFMVFEGLDGSGKSTLMGLFTNELKKQSVKHIIVADPGSTEVGQGIRKVLLDKALKPTPKAELLLYQAARAQLVSEKIKPALEQKSWVVCDRFYPSTLAFQGEARGLDCSELRWLNSYAIQGVHPDFVVWVDTPIVECQNRLLKREGEGGEKRNRMDAENIEFHTRVHKGYQKQAESEGDPKWLRLNGLKPPEDLLKDLLQSLEGFFL